MANYNSHCNHLCSLREELRQAVSFHKEEVARIQKEGEDTLAIETQRYTVPSPPKDFLSTIENLQLQVNHITFYSPVAIGI